MQPKNKIDYQMIDGLMKTLDAQALSSLCAAAKSESAKGYIKGALDFKKLHEALLHGEAKARKNAARLLGALGRREDEGMLISALLMERTRFVRPSILLALGAVGGARAKDALLSLDAPIAADASEEKHAREEAEAIRQALMRLTTHEKHAFTGFMEPRDILLACHAGFSPMLMEELATLDIPCEKRGKAAVKCAVRDFDTVFQARCFHGALIPICENLPATPEAAAARIRAPFLSLLQSCHAGSPPFAYRIEYRGEGDRGAYAASLARALDGDGLINSASSYEAELRITGKDRLTAYCRLFTYPDTRFAYRINALPASIHPAAAACIARMAGAFAPDAKRVLDPFCGSGTLLIEYGLYNKAAQLTGIDIDARALTFARENLGAADLRAGLLHLDCTGFTAREPYDLILANLPFGNRVGTHANNERLYRALAERLVDWLAPDGAALLYTMEYTLLKNCIQAAKGLRRVREMRTEAGGLTPAVVVVTRQK